MSFHRDNLLNTINTLYDETKEKLNIVSLKYDKINSYFNRLTTIVLIISSLITMTNALFLTLNDTISSNNKITTTFTIFIGNTIGLLLSTTATVLTSIIRFRNYRENMEKLKEYQQYLLDINVSLEKERSILLLNENIDNHTIDSIIDHINLQKHKLEKLNIFLIIKIREYEKLRNELKELLSVKSGNTAFHEVDKKDLNVFVV